MSAPPTYLFGVGATKAGTSWLYRFLAGHPDCHLRSVKELHYFDTLDRGGVRRQIRVNLQKAARIADRLDGATGLQRDRLSQTLTDLRDWLAVLQRGAEDPQAYRRYLETGRGDRRLVADITPAYAELSPDRLRAMAALAGDGRFVYVLRDPLARFWSHVRMVAVRSPGGNDDFPAECARVFDSVLAGEPSEIDKRSDYRGALARLRAGVEPQRLLVMFMEHMVTLPGVSQLCEFLGIRPHPADTGARVHEGRALAMTPDQRARARAFLAPQYDFVAQSFPDMPDTWRANMDGVTA